MPPNDVLKKVQDALERAVESERKNRNFLAAIGPAIVEMLRPVLDEIAVGFRSANKELQEAIANIKIIIPEIQSPEIKIPTIVIPEMKVPETKVTVEMPEVKMQKIELPQIKIPQIKIPKPEITVNVPPVKIPKLEWPEQEMPIRGWVNLMGVDMQHPLPVELRDKDGKPVSLIENLTQIISAGGGGARHGKMSVDQLVMTVVSDGRQTTTAGTAVALTTTSTACKKVTVTALPNNTDLVVVGGSTVVASSDGRRGHPLFTGSAITLETDNLNKVYIDVVTTGEGVSFLYLN